MTPINTFQTCQQETKNKMELKWNIFPLLLHQLIWVTRKISREKEEWVFSNSNLCNLAILRCVSSVLLNNLLYIKEKVRCGWRHQGNIDLSNVTPLLHQTSCLINIWGHKKQTELHVCNLARHASSLQAPLLLYSLLLISPVSTSLKMGDLYQFGGHGLEDREPRRHRLRTGKDPKSELLGSHDCNLWESARRSSPGSECKLHIPTGWKRGLSSSKGFT